MGAIPSPSEVLDKYRTVVKAPPKLAGFVRLDYLPYAKYQVYGKWKPDNVKVLFVAESPPWKGNVYFYNENDEGGRPGGLSSNLFRLLGIEGESKLEKLREFKRRSFFLLDTIKCIFHKDKGPIPKELIQFSAREILSREIGFLNPESCPEFFSKLVSLCAFRLL